VLLSQEEKGAGMEERRRRDERAREGQQGRQGKLEQGRRLARRTDPEARNIRERSIGFTRSAK